MVCPHTQKKLCDKAAETAMLKVTKICEQFVRNEYLDT